MSGRRATSRSRTARCMLGALAVGETTHRRPARGRGRARPPPRPCAPSAPPSPRADGGDWSVKGLGDGGLLEPEHVIDFGNAGTGVRLAMGIVGSHAFAATFIGDASLVGRPMGRVLDPLAADGRPGPRPAPATGCRRRSAGPTCRCRSTTGSRWPRRRSSRRCCSPASTRPARRTIIEPVPTRDHTERMLAAFGAAIEIDTGEDGVRIIRLEGRAKLKPQTIVVPGDPSSAAFPIVAALIVEGSDVTVENVLMNPTRTGLVETLIEMGADIRVENRRSIGGEDVGDVRVKAAGSRA